MYPLKGILYNLMANVSVAISQTITRGLPVNVAFDKTPFFAPPLKLDQCRLLTLPKIEVAFSGRPRPGDLQDIERAGGETVKIRGQTKDIHSVRVKDYEALGVVVGFENIDASYRPTEGAISVTQVPSLALLITRVHVISDFLAAVGSFTGGNFDFDLYSPASSVQSTLESGEIPMAEDRYFSSDQ